MSARFLSPGERKKLMIYLKEQFGVSTPQILIEAGKQKVRAFSGTLNREEIVELGKIARVEFLGLYFARDDLGIRLSFDATQVMASEIKHHIANLDEKQFQDWMHGKVLEIALEKGVHVVRYNGDFLGCGFSNGKHLLNYVPRERQLKK